MSDPSQPNLVYGAASFGTSRFQQPLCSTIDLYLLLKQKTGSENSLPLIRKCHDELLVFLGDRERVMASYNPGIRAFSCAITMPGYEDVNLSHVNAAAKIVMAFMFQKGFPLMDYGVDRTEDNITLTFHFPVP